MDDFFINGDLYIKLKPDYETVIEKSPILSDAIFGMLDMDSYIEKQMNLEDLPEPAILDLERNGFLKRVKKAISNHNGFYQIFYDGISFKMINRTTKEVLEYQSYEEIKEKYINFHEFMKKSIFLGRTYASSTPKRPIYDALVTYGQILLLRNRSNGEYTIMHQNSEEIKDYDFGVLYLSYIDKKEIYVNVIKSILKKRRGNDGLKR